MLPVVMLWQARHNFKKKKNLNQYLSSVCLPKKTSGRILTINHIVLVSYGGALMGQYHRKVNKLISPGGGGGGGQGFSYKLFF